MSDYQVSIGGDVGGDMVVGSQHPDPGARLVRDRAVAMLPVPDRTIYVCIVDTGDESTGTEWAVGNCNWEDVEWTAGTYRRSLSDALLVAAGRLTWLAVLGSD